MFFLCDSQGCVPRLRGEKVEQGAHRAGQGGITGGAGTELFAVSSVVGGGRIRVSGVQQIIHNLRYLLVSFHLAALLKLDISLNDTLREGIKTPTLDTSTADCLGSFSRR